jgi:DNA-binding NtrC family response regulator
MQRADYPPSMKDNTMHVVYVDEKKTRSEELAEVLTRHAWRVACFQEAGAALAYIMQTPPDVLLYRSDWASLNLDLIRRTRDRCLHCTIVIVKPHIHVAEALELVGWANDCINRDILPNELFIKTKQAILRQKLLTGRFSLVWHMHQPLDLTPTEIAIQLWMKGYVWEFKKVYEKLVYIGQKG